MIRVAARIIYNKYLQTYLDLDMFLQQNATATTIPDALNVPTDLGGKLLNLTAGDNWQLHQQLNACELRTDICISESSGNFLKIKIKIGSAAHGTEAPSCFRRIGDKSQTRPLNSEL